MCRSRISSAARRSSSSRSRRRARLAGLALAVVGALESPVLDRAMSRGRRSRSHLTIASAADRRRRADRSDCRRRCAAKPRRSKRRRRSTAAIEERIGYRFNDTALLEQRAHPHLRADRCAQPRRQLSAAGVPRRPRARPGRLRHAVRGLSEGRRRRMSRRLADLVRKETCADVARAIDLGAAHPARRVREPMPAARQRTAILGDVCEALIGAVFLDGGYEAASALVERLWAERMRKPARPLRDPKTVLQEWAQARGLPTPAYREVERTGPAITIRNSASRSDLPEFASGRRARPLEARRRTGGGRRHADARRRRGGSATMAEHSDTAAADDPLRLCRADRRAQCRQIDADQRAGRHQGLDRLATRCRPRAR